MCVFADVENRYYDAHRRIAQFLVRDLVWVRTHPQSKASEKCSSKLAPKWSEPAQVMKILGPLNYRLKWQDTDNTDTVHGTQKHLNPLIQMSFLESMKNPILEH